MVSVGGDSKDHRVQPYSARWCRCHVLRNMVLTADNSADRNAELVKAIDMRRMKETILDICCGLKTQ